MHCIVITRFGKNQPGFLDFSYRIRALNKRYQLTIVSNAPLRQAELMVEGAEYIVFPEGSGRIGWLRYIWNCARLIRARQPDCAVLLHSTTAPVALLTRVPTVVYWNEYPARLPGASEGFSPVKQLVGASSYWLAFLGARKAARVMPIGEAHADDLLAHGYDPTRMRLIYMGVDPIFTKVGLAGERVSDESPLELVYIGSVSKARGRDVMLEAVALANRQCMIARLTIVGAGTEQLEYCTNYARQLGIADAVTVHGRVPGHEIPAFLKQADAGLCLWEDQPWWRFNPPTKLFEYLVAGLPVMASNIRTHTQYITHGQNGLIFEYDSSSLAQAIQTLWERRAEMPALKQRAFDSSAPYLWENIEPVFLRTIEELACK